MYQFFTSDLFGVPVDTANMIANGVAALVVLFVVFLLYRMFTRPRMAAGRRSKNARLAITDAASIDDRRRIVLVRRDDVEHLIMIGGANDMVIESDIGKRPAATAGAGRSQPAVGSSIDMATPAAPRRQGAPSGSVRPPTTGGQKPTPSAAPQVSKPQPAPAKATVSVGSGDKKSDGQTGSAPAVAAASNKPADSSPKPKSTVGDNMNSLLTEMSNKK